jgi:non-canonical (house-cleaning) NTP pyrophosphatase
MAVQSSLRPINPPVNPSVARTAAFILPPSISNLMENEGMELGHASDKIFSKNNSKHAEGCHIIINNLKL